MGTPPQVITRMAKIDHILFFTCTSLIQDSELRHKISDMRPEEQSDPSNSSTHRFGSWSTYTAFRQPQGPFGQFTILPTSEVSETCELLRVPQCHNDRERQIPKRRQKPRPSDLPIPSARSRNAERPVQKFPDFENGLGEPLHAHRRSEASGPFIDPHQSLRSVPVRGSSGECRLISVSKM